MAEPLIDSADPQLPWIRRAPATPYFMTQSGEDWTPIGHNDSITWAGLRGVLEGDIASAEAYLAMLARHGVTCLRLMLEYAEDPEGYFENPIGTFRPDMVRLWDEVFGLCRRHSLHVLLTPFDTFWTWLNWDKHPYSSRNGGPLDTPSRILLCEDARQAIKRRLTFASQRWGASGTIFAWDLWNEIHPAQAEESADAFESFISDLSHELRALEMRLYGQSHLQTVSLFGPELWWRPHLNLEAPIFRHPDLDFATIHIYREGTIDDPADTVAPAIDMGKIVADSLRKIRDGRPFLDTEHGPIHRFKDHGVTLPERFDDEYFRHMQWAHLAAGGVGGGMRWPNREPHILTAGMHRAQLALAKFLPLIDWKNFRRRNITDDVGISSPAVRAIGCADEEQAVLWAVRSDTIGNGGVLKTRVSPLPVTVTVSGLQPGSYQITIWDTRAGRPSDVGTARVDDALLAVPLQLVTDLAVAIRRRSN